MVTTDEPAWWGGPETPSKSTVSVLAENDGRLAVIGQVGGLGERVYAVRFIEELAYVVTFRQVDPLHVIDLSDPAHPVVRGELHIPGYSAYLHPIGEGLLMGVGQDATDDGRVLGTQVSVFDVSDPANPVRLHHHSLGQGWSQAEWDHHAFLYDAQRSLAAAVRNLDLGRGDGDLELLERRRRAPRRPAGRRAAAHDRAPRHRVSRRTGAGGAALRRRRVAAFGRRGDSVVPPEVYPTPIQRSLVLGSTLYTLSEAGLKATSLDTFEDTAWVEFPIP